MYVEWIGKRQYAFGLTWVESTRRPGKAEIKAQRLALDPLGRARCHICICSAAGRFTLGAGISDKPLRGTVYSYAATLASTHPDGLYVAKVDDDHLWYCVISGGLVTPETDVIGGNQDILSRIESLRTLLHLEPSAIFASEDIDIEGGSQPFDPASAVQAVRKPVALRVSTTGLSLMPFLVVGAVLLVGTAGDIVWKKYEASKAQQSMSAAQRQQLIQSYHNAVQGALVNYPSNPSWAQAAWQTANVELPPYMAGFHLDTIQCIPSGCDGSYVRSQQVIAFAISPFTDRFGVSAVSIDPQGNAIKVHLALKNPPFVVDDALLHRPPAKNPVALLDWLGRTPLHVVGISERPTMLVSDLASANGGTQVGYPAFVSESVELKGNSPMASALPALQEWASSAGFRITRMESKTPYGGGSEATGNWDIAVQRIHG